MNTTSETSSPILSALNDPAIIRHRKLRMFKDKLAKHSMTIGGISIIIAIVIGILYFTNVITGTLAIILLIVGVVFLLTSFVSFCPLYLPLLGIYSRE